jgi:ethanolamine phosphate phosphodiesterase
VLLDAPGLVEEDYRRVAAKKTFENWTPHADGALELLDAVASNENLDPVLLFSHIPLHRPE